MKKMRRTMAAVMAAAMMATCTAGMTMMSTSAEDTTYSITVTSPTNDKATHTYEAYQVFTGTLSGGKLTEIEWGNGVNGSAIQSAINAITDSSDPLKILQATGTETMSAALIAEKLSGKANDSDVAKAFADLVGKNKTTTTYGTWDSNNKKITGLTAGYYLIQDADDSPTGTDGAKTKFMLKVVSNADISPNAKADVPTISKQVKDGNNWGDWNTASVGDTVTYKITATLPDDSIVSGYESYYLEMTDNLSTGLTFKEITSVSGYTSGGAAVITYNAVGATKDGGGNYVDADDQTYKLNSTDQSKMKITFSDVKDDVHDQKVKTIVVEYTAIVNSNAVMTTGGNPNTVKLNFSNDPNYKHTGEGGTPTTPPNFPESGDIKGVTPESKVNTYTTGIKLTKVDAKKDTSTTLSGAKFTIRGTSLNVVKSDTQYFKKVSTGGTYYLLKDGTYTTVIPVTDTENAGYNADKYEETTANYELVESTALNTDNAGQAFETQGTSESDGVVKFEKMGAGTYYITEVLAPSGYNLLKAPIEVTIAAADSTGKDNVAWTVKKDGTTIDSADTDNLYAFNVENNQGSTLPETGGIGTTIFYVSGSALLVGAAAMFVSKKRKKSE